MTAARYFITECGAPPPATPKSSSVRAQLENATEHLATAIEEIIFLRAELARRDALIKQLQASS